MISPPMARVEYLTTETGLARVDSLTTKTNQTRVSSKPQRLPELSKPIGKMIINIMGEYEPLSLFYTPFHLFPLKLLLIHL
jgi:hypothetical protein